MSMRTAWRPEPEEPLVLKTPEEVLDKPIEQNDAWNYSPRLQKQLRQAVEQAAQGRVSRSAKRTRRRSLRPCSARRARA